MKKQELICDYCGKVASGGEMEAELPKGWCILGYHCQRFACIDDWRITHHFCSQTCLDKAVKVIAQFNSSEK